MSPFLTRKLKSIRNELKEIGWGDALKISILWFIGLFFLWVLYAGFYRLLLYLRGIEIIGGLLILKILSMIFLTFFSMLIFSGLINSFSTIFFASDLSFLFSLPITFNRIFFIKTIETFTHSSWMVIVTMLPFIVAFGNLYDVNIFFYLSVLIASVPFLFIPTLIGIIISILLMNMFPSRKTRDVTLILTIFGIAGIYILFRFLQPEKLINPDKFNEVIQYVTVIQVPTAKYLPSWWFVSLINSFILEEWWKFALYIMIIFISAGILFCIAQYIASKIYYKGWSAAHDFSGKAMKKNIIWSVVEHIPVVSLKTKALFVKDIKLFFRDTNQWSQFLLLIALIVVYLFNIYNLPLNTIYLKSIVSFMNIGLAGFVMSAIALRFIYPSISIEQKSFWMIKSFPISIKYFIREKFYLSLSPMLLLGIILVGISNAILDVDIFVKTISFIAVVLLTTGLTGLGIGMGAIFPKFNVENIPQIESSSGGIFYMIASLFYIGLNLSLLAVPMKMYYHFNLGNPNAFNVVVLGIVFTCLLIINIAIIILPMYLGEKSLEKYEI